MNLNLDEKSTFFFQLFPTVGNDLIWDPAILLCYSRTSAPAFLRCYSRISWGSWHRAWAGNQRCKRLSNTLFYGFYILWKKAHLRASIKMSKGNFNKCISTVACLNGVDSRPSHFFFIQFTTAGRVCVHQLHAYRSPPPAT